MNVYLWIKGVNYLAIFKEILIWSTVLFVILYTSLAANIFAPFAFLFVFPLLIAVIIYMPQLENYPHRMLLNMFILWMFLSVAWPYFVVVDLSAADLHPSRLLLVVIVVLWVYFFLKCKAFRKNLTQYRLLNRFFIVFIVFYLFTQMSGIVFSAYPVNALNGFFKSLTEVIIPTLLAFMVIKTRAAVEFIVNVLILISFFVAIVGVWEYYSNSPFWLMVLPEFLKGSAEHIQSALSPTLRDGEYRLKSIFAHPLSMVQYQAVAVPLIIYRLILTKSVILRLLLTLLLFLTIFVMFESGSRSVIPALIAQIGVALVAIAITVIINKKGSFLQWMYVSMFPFMAVLGSLVLIKGRGLFMGGSDLEYSSSMARFEMWNLGLERIMSNPLAGVFGFGQGSSTDIVNWNGGASIDSYILTVLIDNGILGLIAFVLMNLITVILAYRVWSKLGARDHLPLAIVAAMAGYLVIALISSLNHVLHIFYLMIVLIWVLSFKSKVA